MIIENCLNSIMHQNYKNFELIVVDGHSTDNTVEIARKYTDKVYYETSGTRASACNVGVNHAKGDIIVFTDDDCEVPKDWLMQIAANFNNEPIDVLGGSAITPEQSSKIEKAFGAVLNHLLLFTYSWDSCEKVIGCNSAYKKQDLIEIGGFNEKLPTAEETELNFRLKKLGKKIKYSEKLSLLHNRRGTIRLFCKQQFKFGIGKGKWLRSNPSAIKASNIIVQLLIFGTFVILPILVVFNLTIASIILLTGFGLLLTSAFYASIKEKQVSIFPFIILATIIWIYAQGFGQLSGLLQKEPQKNL